jgi:site-specific recombinase XerD
MKTPRKPKTTKKPNSKIAEWECEGLTIYTRGNTFHVRGTLRVGKRTQRVRETLGVEAIKEKRENAESEVRKIAGKVRAELGGGVVHRAVATLVAERFEEHTGPSDKRILRDFTSEFKVQILWDIAPEVIVAFVDRRQRGNAPETKERFISTICAFLNLQIAAGQYLALPKFKRNQKARNPSRRAKRPVNDFRIDLVEAIINAAHPTIGIQIRVEWICGARVSSVVQGCTLGDLNLQTMTLTFRDTKNGDDVPIAIPESMRGAFLEYLRWRSTQVKRRTIGPGSHEPLFLHYRGKPYKPNDGAWGTQNKSGFNAAKRRALKTIEAGYDAQIQERMAAGDEDAVDRLFRSKADDLRLLRRITQHWLRHKFATDVGRRDPQSAMKQGGWLDIRSLNGYMIADAEYQRELIEQRGSPAMSPADANGAQGRSRKRTD